MITQRRQGESKKDRSKRLSDYGRRGAIENFETSSKGRNCLRRCGVYTKLYTIRIENHITGTSQEIVLMQGDRANNYYVSCFGRCMSKAIGMHKVLTELAKKLVIRWLEL